MRRASARLPMPALRDSRAIEMKAARVLGVASCVLAVDCSGGGSLPRPAPIDNLDCAWLASDNCMKATLMAGMSCVGPPAEIGVLSADSTTCTYPSGVVVTFDAPLVLPLGLNPPGWHFTVTRAGAECLRFESTDNANFKLVVNGSTLSEAAPIPGATLTITCPDGTSYSNSNPPDAGLLYCDPGGLPSQGFSSSETSGTFWIQLFPTDVVLTLFNCLRQL